MRKVRVKINVNVQKNDTTKGDTVRVESNIEKKDSIPRVENPKLEVQPHNNNTQTGRLKLGERNDSIRKRPVIIKIKRR